VSLAKAPDTRTAHGSLLVPGCLPPGKAQQSYAHVHPLAARQGRVHPARAPVAGPREATRQAARPHVHASLVLDMNARFGCCQRAR